MSGEWLRGKGLGRERLAGYVADFLETLGYTVSRTEQVDPPQSRVVAQLGRMNPSVPPSGNELRFSLSPTSGGCALVWEFPSEVAPADRSRMDRLEREIATHLERAIATESHAAAHVVRPTVSQVPWKAAAPAPGAP